MITDRFISFGMDMNSKERTMYLILKMWMYLKKPYIQTVDTDSVIKIQRSIRGYCPIIKKCGKPQVDIWNFAQLASVLYSRGFLPESLYKFIIGEKKVNTGSEYPVKYDPLFKKIGKDVDKYLKFTKEDTYKKHQTTLVKRNEVVWAYYAKKKLKTRVPGYGFGFGVSDEKLDNMHNLLFTERALYEISTLKYDGLLDSIAKAGIKIIILKRVIDKIKKYPKKFIFLDRFTPVNNYSSTEITIINTLNYKYVQKYGKWNDKGYLFG